ncbi:hypothetical protein R6138_04189 [Ralstonia thomasii]|uniref:DNA-directed RNA polymerase n=1 Tax=Ralstonia thomasii TaxID=3058596 RepID=UPI0028F62F64|nr:DNA-directed RNA polymerase [Ralstonia sp. LMG 18095]CAJ0898192.1 hypothetical protein R6138_04189 [Ralstonia sp. LMG 18095]
MTTILEYQAQRAQTHTVAITEAPEERAHARTHVARLIEDGYEQAVRRQLVREAASERKITEADLQRDALERGLTAFRNALATARVTVPTDPNDVWARMAFERAVETGKAKIEHTGKKQNPVNGLSVEQQAAACWSALCSYVGKLADPEGVPVQTVAGAIGRRLRDACGGAPEYGRLGYERAGLVLIDWLGYVTGWVEERTGERAFGTARQEANSLHITQTFLDDALGGVVPIEFMERKPMLVPPVPWTPSARDGGFLYAPVQAIRGVRKGIGSSEIVDALNALQGTAWRVNSRVLSVARSFERNAEDFEVASVVMGKVLEVRHDMPQEQARSKTIRSALTLAAFGELEHEEAFYFPWNLDWRGRMYPATTLVSPQGSDLCKGLLEFADGTPMGRDGGRWLAIHLCNLAGADKRVEGGEYVTLTPAEREAWALEHSDTLCAIAADPHSNTQWRDPGAFGLCKLKGTGTRPVAVDKPWQFLAACFEWADYQAEGPGFRSRLAGALDGSCSGVQMLSGMTRDAGAGAMVNLTPTERGADYYRTMSKALDRRLCQLVDIANPATMAHLSHWAGYTLDRDLLKAPSMTKVYSAGVFTFGEQVAAKTGASESECLWLAQHIDACFGDVAPGMLAAMAYLQGVSAVLTGAGHSMRWVTPAGLEVEQARVTEVTHELATPHPATGIKRKRLFTIDTDKLSKRGQRAGVSPNFVHGVDASHMVFTVNALYRQGVRNFWMVHDSFGAPFAQCDAVYATTRDTFIELMSSDLLDEWTQQVTAPLTEAQRSKLPMLPTYGELDLNAVRDSVFAWF